MSKLCKEICKKCVNECARQKEEEWKITRLAWSELDEYWWDRGMINCREVRWGLIVNCKAPKTCLYRFEHFILSEKPQ